MKYSVNHYTLSHEVAISLNLNALYKNKEKLRTVSPEVDDINKLSLNKMDFYNI